MDLSSFRTSKLDFGLSFEDLELEQGFQDFYSATFSVYARKAILLVVLLLLGDFAMDVLFLRREAGWATRGGCLPSCRYSSFGS
jgi:hypothetical protein